MEGELRTSVEKSVNFCSKSMTLSRILQEDSSVHCSGYQLFAVFFQVCQSFSENSFSDHKNQLPFLKPQLNFEDFTSNLSAHTLTKPRTPFLF